LNPELTIESDKVSIEEGADLIMAKLEELGYLEPEALDEDETQVVTDRLSALGYL
jgi:hypothetical protein